MAAARTISCVTLWVITAAGLSNAGVTSAQSLGILPPTVSARDINGVDLIGGSLEVPMPSISIGSNGSGLTRTGLGFNPFLDNLTGTINQNRMLDDAAHPDGMVTVSLNGNSEVWVINSVSYNPANAQYVYTPVTPYPQNGPTLNTFTCSGSNCTYTLADGTVATFTRSSGSALQVGIKADYAVLTQLVKPDGEIQNYYYKSFDTVAYVPNATNMTIRGQRMITSSLGWTLKYQLGTGNTAIASTTISLINSSVVYCSDTSDTCTDIDNASWPTLVGKGFYPDTNGVALEQVGGLGTGYNVPISTLYVGNYTSSLGGSLSSTQFPESEPPHANWNNDFKIHTLTRAGSTWNYEYSAFDAQHISTTTVTDPSGHTRIARHGCSLICGIHPGLGTGLLVSMQDELGRITKYTWNGPNIRQIISPEATYSGTDLTGGYTQFDYDTRGHVVTKTVFPKGGGTPLVAKATYPTTCDNPKTCNKPLTITDAKNISTTYTYDPNHGGVLTETKAAVNGVEAQTRYKYSQITPYLKDASGNLVAQSPVWRLTEVSTCRTMTLATCVSTADELRTIVSYGPDNSNPTYKNVLPVSKTVSAGDGSLSQMTSFTYDNRGNVTVEDGPLPGTVDTTYFQYDAYNRTTWKIEPDPDGSGLLLRPATHTVYDLEGKVKEIQQGNVSGSDGSGWVEAKFQRMTYDTAGHLAKTEIGQP